MGWFKIFNQLVEDGKLTAEEIHELSKECGHEMSLDQIKEKLAKMPEWIKMGEAWKAKMGGGKCGFGGGMGSMMKECMKKFMDGK